MRTTRDTRDIGGTWTVRAADGDWVCSEDSLGSGSCSNGIDTYAW